MRCLPGCIPCTRTVSVDVAELVLTQPYRRLGGLCRGVLEPCWDQGSGCEGSLMALGQGSGVNGVMGRAAQKQESVLSTGSSSLGAPVVELPVPKPSS